jgi:hypothetical protein
MSCSVSRFCPESNELAVSLLSRGGSGPGMSALEGFIHSSAPHRRDENSVARRIAEFDETHLLNHQRRRVHLAKAKSPNGLHRDVCFVSFHVARLRSPTQNTQVDPSNSLGGSETAPTLRDPRSSQERCGDGQSPSTAHSICRDKARRQARTRRFTQHNRKSKSG